MIKFIINNAVKLIRYNKKSNKFLFFQNLIIFLLIFLFSLAEQVLIKDITKKYSFIPRNYASAQTYFGNAMGVGKWTYDKKEIEDILKESNLKYHINEVNYLRAESDLDYISRFNDILAMDNFNDGKNINESRYYNLITGRVWTENQNETEIEIIISEESIEYWFNDKLNPKTVINQTLQLKNTIKDYAVNAKIIGVYQNKQHIPFMSNERVSGELNIYKEIIMSNKHFNTFWREELPNYHSANNVVVFDKPITKKINNELNSLVDENDKRVYFISRQFLVAEELVKYTSIFNFLNLLKFTIFIISIAIYLFINSNLLANSKKDLVIRKIEGARFKHLFMQIAASSLFVGVVAIIFSLVISAIVGLIIGVVINIWTFIDYFSFLYIPSYLVIIVIFSFLNTLKISKYNTLNIIRNEDN